MFTEYHLLKNGTECFIDVFVDLDGYGVAIEIEMSTRHVVANATKALQVGCHEVQLVFPTARLRDAARRKLVASLPREKLNRMAFLLLGPYEARTYRRKNRFLRGKRSRQKSEKAENESREER